MWDAEMDDDAAFERRLDAVAREIGDRGKPMLMAFAPAPAPTPAVAPATAPAPAPAPAPASAAVSAAATPTRGRRAMAAPERTPQHNRSFTPSMQPQQAIPQQHQQHQQHQHQQHQQHQHQQQQQQQHSVSHEDAQFQLTAAVVSIEKKHLKHVKPPLTESEPYPCRGGWHKIA